VRHHALPPLGERRLKASPWRARAEAIAGGGAARVRERLVVSASASSERVGEEAIDLATAIACAYPALALSQDGHWDDVVAVASGTKTARDARAYRRLALAHVGDGLDNETVRRGLRVFARRAKLRVAARELVPHAGSDVDVTSRELSDLADVCIQVALTEALAWADARIGVPATSSGERCPFVVIGMGKLGGRELNPGSDVDLMLFYETDEGAVVGPERRPTDVSLHEYFTKVTQRMTATLDDVTEDGVVFRVDLRLRPEGARGPLVNALPAAERYYESWGRTWERAALSRARPSAGDLGFGRRLLDALAPFVWRRGVDPKIAGEMAALVRQARAEATGDPERDVKIGRGGIREAEFFVQALLLIWGGRDPSLRAGGSGTLEALRRLRARGFVTDREGREAADAYVALRRLEHRIQFATGVQTHTLPPPGELLETIARSLGFRTGRDLEADLAAVREGVADRLRSLTGGDEGAVSSRGALPSAALLSALDDGDEPAVLASLEGRSATPPSPDLARHLLALARRPDFPLGAQTRDAFPELAPVLLEALWDAADPEQAARLLSTFFARTATPSVYARMLATEASGVSAARRMASLFGASAFLGEAIAYHPELADGVLWNRGVPGVVRARGAVKAELATLTADERRDPDAFVGALRRAKGQILIEVGLADLAGELTTRDCTLTLSALADATLEEAAAFVERERDERGTRVGLAVIAMGKLGGSEIGYGSDLDLFFVYDGRGDDDDACERAVRQAQRVLRILSAPHGEGPGYELDTRLRPSGHHGLLVVSRDAFARYHGLLGPAEGASEAPVAEAWERQALIKARFVAGDAELGAAVMALAQRAAYETAAPDPSRLHHIRLRMERELGAERRSGGRARYDLKVGHGGLVDVEFAAQWLQMKHGSDLRVRTGDTELALAALEAGGYLDPAPAAALREGYQMLRRLEQRLRVLHGTSAQWIEEGAPGLAPLARRLGMRDGPWGTASEALLARYRAVTDDVRAAYLQVIGVTP
jgi:glutamate-ammonia-ligase adenylyltransferase